MPEVDLPERDAPLLEPDLLRRMARKELSGKEAERVYTLVALFRSWRTEYAKAVVDFLHEGGDRRQVGGPQGEER